MELNKIKKNPYLIAFGVGMILFSLFALIYAIRFYLLYIVSGEPISFFTFLYAQLKVWLAYAVFVPLIIWLGRKCPIEHKNWYWSIPFHILYSINIVVIQTSLYFFIKMLIYPSHKIYPQAVLYFFFSSITVMMVVYWIVIGVDYVITYQRKNRAQALKTAQMQTQLAQAQLEVLKSQIQPHFLFNTLHTITALMFEDVNSANEMITKLSDLLRLSLDRTNQQEVTLREELEFIETYLDIQKTRFKGRLEVETNIDTKTLDAFVPSMLLQPIVENAISHGISPHKKTGKIRLVSNSINGILSLEIHDSGKGIKSNKDKIFIKGVGISNTIERLKQLYTDEYKFELTNSPEGGLAVLIEIPLRINSSFDDNYRRKM